MIENGQPEGGYLLKYGAFSIPFNLTLKNCSKLRIDVYPDQRVEVVAPDCKDRSAILDRVERRARWIVKQWRYFEQFQPKLPCRRYVSGETHVYLGRQYRLKVRRSDLSEVKLVGRYFRISHPIPGDSAAIARLLAEWYINHARQLFAGRIEWWLAECRWLSGLDSPPLQVRRMQRRWGSCTKARSITLNVELAKVPLMCIDYVIVHELCHLKIHNHNAAFYRLLKRCLPDWQQRKQRLDEFRLE